MAAFLLSLREGLEATLIVGILLGTLQRLGRNSLRRFVWLGASSALIVSIVAAAALVTAGIEIEGRAEQIFEGVTLLLAASLLTGMILWMQQQGARLHSALEGGVRLAAESAHTTGGWGLWAVAFVAVVREGMELALLLVATSLTEKAGGVIIGAGLGIAAAIVLGLLIYNGVLRLNLRVFFQATNLLLVLFAAGMVTLGCHEFVEAGILPAIVDPVYNINGLLSDQSVVGGLLRSLFGYNSAPALIETVAYILYLGIGAWLLWGRKQQRASAPPV